MDLEQVHASLFIYGAMNMPALQKNPPVLEQASKDIERMSSQGFGWVGISKFFGVSKQTIKRWIEQFEEFGEAYEAGRESHKQRLIAIITEDANNRKPPNINAFFLLKAMHGLFDSPTTKVDVSVNASTNVMVVRSHGTDEEWAKAAAEQQRKLVEGNFDELSHALASRPQIEAPQVVASAEMPSWLPPAPSWGASAPSWNQTIQDDYQDATVSARRGEPVSSSMPIEWRPRT